MSNTANVGPVTNPPTSKKHVGRQPSDYRLQAITKLYGSLEAYDTARQSMSYVERLMANDNIIKLTSKIRILHKNNGVPGIRGRLPAEARVHAVKLLYNTDYPNFRAWVDSQPEQFREGFYAKVTSLTVLLEAGVVLDADEAMIFMGVSEDETHRMLRTRHLRLV